MMNEDIRVLSYSHEDSGTRFIVRGVSASTMKTHLQPWWQFVQNGGNEPIQYDKPCGLVLCYKALIMLRNLNHDTNVEKISDLFQSASNCDPRSLVFRLLSKADLISLQYDFPRFVIRPVMLAMTLFRYERKFVRLSNVILEQLENQHMQELERVASANPSKPTREKKQLLGIFGSYFLDFLLTNDVCVKVDAFLIIESDHHRLQMIVTHVMKILKSRSLSKPLFLLNADMGNMGQRLNLYRERYRVTLISPYALGGCMSSNDLVTGMKECIRSSDCFILADFCHEAVPQDITALEPSRITSTIDGLEATLHAVYASSNAHEEIDEQSAAYWMMHKLGMSSVMCQEQTGAEWVSMMIKAGCEEKDIKSTEYPNIACNSYTIIWVRPVEEEDDPLAGARTSSVQRL